MKKESMKVYRVEVKCTGALKNACANYHGNNGRIGSNTDYFDCEDGYLYVSTNDPSKIFNMLSEDTVISIKRVGVGYTI
jgi:hypothetical protein